jgi:uncharacterized protein (DUF433 family)
MGGRQMQQSDIYGGQDPREMPAYSIPEAAHYLQMPSSTLRWWVKGWTYRTDAGERFSAPLLTLPMAPERKPLLLSFVNIVEAHVLDALRRDHHVAMPKVREALSYLEAHFPSPHPLADQRFKTDGIHLFIERYGQLINISHHGQLAMDHVLRMYLSRIEHDSAGVPVKLYLFTRLRQADEPKVVAIDPYVSFGRPVLVGTGIPTAVIADRYKAGESIQALADDYECAPRAIEEAIRCELNPKVA